MQGLLIITLRYATIMIFLALMVAGASAYEIAIDAPTSIQAGAPLLVNGTTNLADGVSISIALSNADYTTIGIEKKDIVVEHSDENKSFSVEFNTTGLKKGQYKVEVLPIPGYSFLGSSVTIRPVILIDRSDELVIAPPLSKEFDGSLTIAGNGPRMINSGVDVIVTSLNGTLQLGPEFIGTDYMGYFSKTFSIPEPGDYLVHFSDARGFIGNITYTITKPREPLPTLVQPEATTRTLVATQSPLVYAKASASRDVPAYFAVIANPGPVRVSTSTGIDWVIEYLDRTGTIHKVHDAGSQYPESVTFQSDGGTIWVKIYPFKYEDNSTVTLYAENAMDVQAAANGIDFFPTTNVPTSVPVGVQTSPLPLVLFLGATGIAILVMIRKWK
jgi:hypothetical protein